MSKAASKTIEKPKNAGPATVFINARLLDPASSRDEPGGLLVKDGVIADLGSHLRRNAPEGATVIDCKGHVLAPGLIDTCSYYLEHPELIAQRIERFAGIVGKDRVLASTDCGFGTFAGYGKLDPLGTWKKLRALREGADIADKRL